MDIDNGIVDNSINGGSLYQLKNEFNTFDSGFESILIDRDDDSFSFKSSTLSSIVSSPSSQTSFGYFETPKKHEQQLLRTPIKQQQQQHQLLITPNSNRKQQIADVDSIYLAFLKSPLKSPQNVIASNQDNYLRERDTLKANLLRSPAFKHVSSSQLIPPEPIKRIKCKDFTLKHEQDDTPQPQSIPVPPPPPPVVQAASTRRTTPTEDEFVELLFKNHLPKNPNCLIGRHMGIDQIDIINELNKRSMNNVIDVIMNNLSALDYQAMFNVSKTWRYVIESDTYRNKSRIKYIKFRRKYIEATKENQTGLSPNLKKSTKFSPKKRLSNGAFSKLDINRLNNDAYNETTSIFIDKTNSFERKLIINDYKQINELHQHHQQQQQKETRTTANNWFLLDKQNTMIRSDGDVGLNSSNDSLILNNKTTKTATKIGSKTSKKNLKRL